VVLYQSSEES
jgi:hypothetical protein